MAYLLDADVFNPDFKPIELTGADEGQVRVIAECVEVLQGSE
jgi:hypothetical protein